MKRQLAPGFLSVVVGIVVLGSGARPAGMDEPQQAHTVFFTLKDHSTEARQRLVAACHEHLSGHEGTVSFAVGTIAEDVVEPVSDRDFDVALHLVFESKAAGGKYLKHPRHLLFIEENKDSWSRVRVFDSYLIPAKQ